MIFKIQHNKIHIALNIVTTLKLKKKKQCTLYVILQHCVKHIVFEQVMQWSPWRCCN